MCPPVVLHPGFLLRLAVWESGIRVLGFVLPLNLFDKFRIV